MVSAVSLAIKLHTCPPIFSGKSCFPAIKLVLSVSACMLPAEKFMDIDRQDSALPRAAKAVALEYDKARDPAPRVTASGDGHLAAQIIKIAEEHGIPIRKDANLAEILSALEVDSFIPLEAYAAVAEILSYIYRSGAARRESEA